jgi:hypothetical protein
MLKEKCHLMREKCDPRTAGEVYRKLSWIAYAEAAKHDELYRIGYEPGSQGGIDHAIRDNFNHQARDLYKEAERLDALLLTGS